MTGKHEPAMGDRALSFGELVDENIYEIHVFYAALQPDVEDDFLENFYDPLAAIEDISGRAYIQKFIYAPAETIETNPKHIAMTISCAYSMQAVRAYANNNIEPAYLYLAEARYWCGAMNATSRIEQLREAAIVGTRKAVSSHANKVRNEGFAKMRVEAFRLAKEKCPIGKWTSRLNAAENIKDLVVKFGLELKEGERKHLTPTRAAKTIADWLKQMPDADKFFQTHKRC